MQKLYLAQLLLIFLLFVGCAQTYKMPANKFESPEVTGNLGALKIELAGIETGPSMTVKPDINAGDEVNKKTTLSTTSPNFSAGTGVGVSEEIDIGVRFQAGAPLLIKLKYQFLGKPESKSQVSAFSASLISNVGFTLIAQSFGDATATGETGKLNANYYSGDFGLIGGYRFSLSSILYLGTSYGFHSYSGKMSPAAGSGVTFSGNASLLSIILGYKYDLQALFLNFEIAYGITTTAGLESALKSVYPGFLVGLRI